MNRLDRPYGAGQEIRTVPDLMYAIGRAQSQEDRLRIINRAQYLGWARKLPNNWNPDGSLREGEE